MKKLLFTLLVCGLSAVSIMAQSGAKKPTIMVVPSDNWCVKNGYVQKYNNQGTEVTIPDYTKAFQNSTDLKLAIAKINDLMAERGFPLKDLEATIKQINQSVAEDNLTTSKTGAELMESPLDKIRRTAKADIIYELTWSVNETGPKRSVTYILEAKDAYTNKSIGSNADTGAPSFSADVPTLLVEAIVSHIDELNLRLQTYFDDLFQNGREVAVDVRVFQNDEGIDLESEYNGMELAEIIDGWMEQNTVEHRFNKLDGSESVLRYEQVRIPLLKPNGMTMDTESFVRQLRQVLRKEPYNITCKVATKGLGKAVLIIGGK